MKRRRFLMATTAGLIPLAAGCGGQQPAQGGERETETSQRTTTTTGNEFGSPGSDPPEAGPYQKWVVNLTESNIFLGDYLPDYQSTLNTVNEGVAKNRVKRFLSNPTDQRPSAVLKPENVREFFHGFLEGSVALRYIYIRGEFDRASVAKRVRDEKSFENADESVADLQILSKTGQVVGLSSEEFYWVKVGFADPIENLQTVIDTIAGDAPSYMSSNENYKLLLENEYMRNGHWILTRPSVADDYGATAYGRSYHVGEESSIPHEIAVFEDSITKAEYRDTLSGKSNLINEMNGSITEVTTNNRVGVARLDPLPNNRILTFRSYS